MSKSRRIPIHYANYPYISSSPCEPSNSHSIIGFGRVVKLRNPPDESYLEWLCKSSKLVQKGAMSSLQRLVLDRCKFSIMPPDELSCLTTLRGVVVLHPSPKLAKMLQQLQMRGGCKLQVYAPLHPTN
ncbi:hypothetical protein CFP56_009104 [Quercus suber]|uniref:Uncharacterized protein n=1 Tax=Quercus suber TaxID=58331 RepID=A0AAW0L3W2_QUESU